MTSKRQRIEQLEAEIKRLRGPFSTSAYYKDVEGIATWNNGHLEITLRDYPVPRSIRSLIEGRT